MMGENLQVIVFEACNWRQCSYMNEFLARKGIEVVQVTQSAAGSGYVGFRNYITIVYKDKNDGTTS